MEGKRRQKLFKTEIVARSEDTTVRREATTRTRNYDRARDTREKLFYLFLFAQVCAIFGMVVGVLFFIWRLLKAL